MTARAGRPMTAREVRPMTAREARPMTAREARPMTALEVRPMTARCPATVARRPTARRTSTASARDECDLGSQSLRLCGRSAHEASVIAATATLTTTVHAASSRATWETSAPIMLKKIPA